MINASLIDSGRSRLWGGAWAVCLTALIGGPWLAGGYLFGTDWAGTRRFDFPTALSSSAPVSAVLALVSRLISGEATGKVLFFSVLFAAAFAAYEAAPVTGFVPRAAGAAVYAVNPFVFGRLHYGQLFLLAGYAALPWFALRLRLLCTRPTWTSAVLAAISLSLVGVFTAHLFLAGLLLGAAALYAYALIGRRTAGDAGGLGRSALLAGASTLVLNSYWLVPFALGKGAEAGVIAGTGAGELANYAAVPDPALGLVPNLIGLYGFWAEDAHRFTSMKHFVPGWPVVLLAVLVVAAIGAVRSRRDPALRPWIAALAAVALIALYLEMGLSNPLSSDLVRWLDAYVPAYRGMRDAGKWAALLALVYSQLFALGAAAVLGRVPRPRHASPRAEWLREAAIGLLLAVPLYYGNGLFFGMHGEVRPSAYPSGWYAADRVLAADPRPGRTLFLPWHEYLRLSFVHNENSVIACPAPAFFAVPVVCSKDPELPGVAPPGDPEQSAVSSLVNEGRAGAWAQVLASHGIKYVLLAHESDWHTYEFLNAQSGLKLVGDYGSLTLYRDLLWR